MLKRFLLLASLVPTILAAQEMHWRMIGPFRGGRTRPVAGVHGNPDIFYIAQVNGGIWKSDDAGRTWTPIFDNEPTQSIGALEVAPSDPNTIYAGSGEGLHRPDLAVGNGMYKSNDAGKTWQHLGLDDAQQIANLAIDPRDPNRVFVAVLGHPYGPNATRGIYRTTDGGRSWQRVLYKDENTGANDVEIDPSDPNTVYASLWQARLGPSEDNNEFDTAGGGLFKSTDGGNTWKQLKNGLPSNLTQGDIAVAPSTPHRVYAVVATTEPSEYMTGKGMGLYRSDDAGESWTRITEDPRPMMLIGGGDLPVIKVDPNDADVVYSASIVTVRSMDGGKTWTSLRGAPGGDDYQNLWIDPRDSNTILLGSDQGAVVSVNFGRTWSSWYNQPTAQLYHVGVTPTFPYQVCSGQQESGSVCITSRGESGAITFRDWKPVGTIEYGYVTPDPLDADIVFGGGRDEVTMYRWSTGEVQNVTPIPIRGEHRVTRTEPVIFSPADPRILYYGANVLFRTTDRGRTWQTISPDLAREHPGVPPSVGAMAKDKPKAQQARGSIYSVAPGVRDVNTIWAGTDDGYVWITRDGGAHWTNITPPSLTAWSAVRQIDASHFDNDTAYIAVSRLRVDDLHPYIFRTHDGGKTWQPIANGLPDSPVDTVREDPVRKGLLFAGTESAVWYSTDDGDHWQSLQMNLPHTAVRDLVIHGDDIIVATHGRSFWILDDIAPLRQERQMLYKPAQAVRVRRSLNTDTPLPADEPMGENPPDGAIIDYDLDAAASVVTLEIVGVRKFSSNDKPWITQQALAAQAIPPYWVKPPQVLSTTAGMHRFVWDLHYPSPVSLDPQYPISAVPGRTPRGPLGPWALPGTYTVRITANGKTVEQPLVVAMDPRITGQDLKSMFDLQTRLADMLTRSSEALLKERAKKPATTGQPTKKEEVTPQKQTPAPPTLESVQSDIATLYDQIDRADATPTAAQVQAVNDAAARLETVMKGGGR